MSGLCRNVNHIVDINICVSAPRADYIVYEHWPDTPE